MDKRVTPPKRVTSPTWGPPPPCKQALSGKKCMYKEILIMMMTMMLVMNEILEISSKARN